VAAEFTTTRRARGSNKVLTPGPCLSLERRRGRMRGDQAAAMAAIWRVGQIGRIQGRSMPDLSRASCA
jgi:hypothetical protein